MKIAFIGIKGLPSKGGAERVVEAIVQRLSGQHTLTVYCSRYYTGPEARVPGVRLVAGAGPSRSVPYISRLAHARKLVGAP